MRKSQSSTGKNLVNRTPIQDRRGKKHRRGEKATPKPSNMATWLGQDEDVSPATHQQTKSRSQNPPYLNLNSKRCWWAFR